MLRADLTQLRRDLKAAEAEYRAFNKIATQLGTVRLGAVGLAGGAAGLGGGTTGGSGRRPAAGGATDLAANIRSQQERAGGQLNAFFRRVERDQQQHEQALTKIHADGIARRVRADRDAAREAANAEAFLTRQAQGGVRNATFERREQATAARAQRRVEEALAGQNVRALGLPTRTQAARTARGGGPGGGPARGPVLDPRLLDDVIGKVSGGLTDAFQRASRAAQQLNLIIGVSIFGGLGGLIAEGFRLNAQFEQLNVTMAATLATTNNVVDAQGKIVEGPAKANFLLKGTAGLYDQIRKVASESLLEQSDLIETVAENLGLAQQAGFKLETLSKKETEPVVRAIANISQLAKAVGLPGGQRQLSQEVRALFTGERLQGATVARLLGFRDIKTIQELQAKPGKEKGTTAFIDELNARFARAKPILEAFKNTATGVFTTLISQGRLFLQIFTQAAFKEIVGSARQLRDFLTDERIKATAEEVGASFGRLVHGLVEFAKASAPLLKLFTFLVQNAGVLIGLFGAFKALQGVQALAGLAGGIGAGGGVRGLLGRALAGGLGGAAAGEGGAALGSIIGGVGRVPFGAAAPGAVGLGTGAQLGALLGGRPFSGPAGRAFGGLLGPIGGAGAAGIGAIAGGTAILGSLLTGVGLGTLVRTQAEQAGTRAGARPAAQQVDEDRAARVASIADLAARRNAAAATALRLTNERFAARAQGRAIGQPQVSSLLERTLFGRAQGGVIERTPEFTSRVTAGGQLAVVAKRQREIEEARALAQKLERERLQKIADENASQRIQALLSLAQVRRNKEAEIQLTSQLDAGAARTEIQDRTALAIKLQAIEEQRLQKFKELREDEQQQAKEGLAQALNDEVATAKLRAQRRRTEIEREFAHRPGTEGLRHQAELAAGLTAQRELVGAQINRFTQRAGVVGQLAGARGQVFTQIRAQEAADVAAFAQQVNDQKATVAEFEAFRVARHAQANEEIRRKQLEFYNQSVDLVFRFADAVKQATRLQQDHELELIRFKEKVRDRDFARVKARLQEEETVRRAFQQRADTHVDAALFARTRAQQRAAFQALVAQGAGGSIEEQLQRRAQRQLGTARETRDLPLQQRTELAAQQARETIRGLVDTLLGPGGVTEALKKLKEEGISLTRAQEARLAAPGVQAGNQREDRTVFGEIRQAQQVREGVVDSDRALTDAQDERRQAEKDDRRTLRDERIERKRADEDFLDARAKLAVEFSRTKEDVREFAREAKRAGIALSEGITRVFQKALGVKVPDTATLAVQEAAAAVAANAPRGARPRAGAGSVTGPRGTTILPRRRVRGSFEELQPEEATGGLPRNLFGQPGQPITGLHGLIGQTGDVGAQADRLIQGLFSGAREQTVTAIPGVNLNGLAVSKETADLVKKSMTPTGTNLAPAVIQSTSPPFVGSRRPGESPAGGAQQSSAGGVTINLTGLQIGADTKETIDKLGTQLQRDARRTPAA